MENDVIAENGYVIIAVNPIEFKQAQCCAYSIKSKMPTANITINLCLKYKLAIKESLINLVIQYLMFPFTCLIFITIFLGIFL